MAGLSIGGVVWKEQNANQIADPGDALLDNVAVELRSADGSTLLATMNTTAGGAYRFDGLAEGSYIVRLPAVDFNPGGVLRDYRSLAGASDPNNDIRNDDNGLETNGLLGLGGFVQTGLVTLTTNGEPVNDGDADPNTNLTIDFGLTNFGPPQIDVGGVVDFVEGSGPVLLDPAARTGAIFIGLGVDFENATLRVSVAAASAEDALTIVAGNGITLSGSTVSYNGTAIGTVTGGPAGTGLVFTGTITPEEAMNALVRQIAYQDTNTAAPAIGSRNVNFVLTNGVSTSETDVVLVDVMAVNDAPAIGGDAAVTVAEGGAVVITSADLDATDVDNTDAELVYTVTAAARGSVRLNGADATSFTQDDVVNGRVTFLHDGGEADGSFTVSLSDGTDSGGSATVTVTVDPHVDDAPSDIALALAGPRLAENSAAGTLVGALTATDADDASFTYALLDDAGGRFAVAGSNLVVGNGALIDYEQQASHAVTVQVTDGSGLTFQKDFIIGIADVAGLPGDGSFAAPAGTSQIEGGGGTDTITFGFRLTDATVTYAGPEVIIDGPGGSHTILMGFEKYVFTDGTIDNNDGSPLIDDLFYYARYHDVWNAHVDADLHYNVVGWMEGRDPSAFFDTSIYLSANPDVAKAGVNPLAHYDTIGWNEGRVPSLDFDARAYLAANPDVAAAHVDPLAHFLGFGATEGRQPIAPTELIAANGFDYVYYLARNPDVAAAGVDPFQHFETTGWKEGRNPNALFDVSGYLANYADVAAAHVNPLDHYNQFGWQEGRDPSPGFDTTSYLAAYADVNAAHINPLTHFLQFGTHEGRSPFADGIWG